MLFSDVNTHDRVQSGCPDSPKLRTIKYWQVAATKIEAKFQSSVAGKNSFEVHNGK